MTTDGTVANYEALWLARNLKSFPMGVKKVNPKLLQGMDDWQLLNLPTKNVLDLIDTAEKAGAFEKAFRASARGKARDMESWARSLCPRPSITL